MEINDETKQFFQQQRFQIETFGPFIGLRRAIFKILSNIWTTFKVEKKVLFLISVMAIGSSILILNNHLYNIENA